MALPADNALDKPRLRWYRCDPALCKLEWLSPLQKKNIRKKIRSKEMYVDILVIFDKPIFSYQLAHAPF